MTLEYSHRSCLSNRRLWDFPLRGQIFTIKIGILFIAKNIYYFVRKKKPTFFGEKKIIFFLQRVAVGEGEIFHQDDPAQRKVHSIRYLPQKEHQFSELFPKNILKIVKNFQCFLFHNKYMKIYSNIRVNFIH